MSRQIRKVEIVYKTKPADYPLEDIKMTKPDYVSLD